MDTMIHDEKIAGQTVPSCTLAIATIPCQPWDKPYDTTKALCVGTIFPNLHMPFFKGGDADKSPKDDKPSANTREKMLLEIDKVGFAVNDITLYLDTHPTDAEALEYFEQCMAARKELFKQYASEFEPLDMNEVCPGSNNQSNSHNQYGNARHWTWSDGPMPWEGGTN